MANETAKAAADAIVSTDKSTAEPTTKTDVVANDGKEKAIAPTITFGGTPGSRRIRVEGVSESASYNPDAAPSSILAEELQEELDVLRAGLPNDILPELKPSPLLLVLKTGGWAI